MKMRARSSQGLRQKGIAAPLLALILLVLAVLLGMTGAGVGSTG